VTNIQPKAAAVAGTAATTGMTVDQRLTRVETILETGVKTAEADVVSDFDKVKAWFVANWPHFVTWAGGVYLVVKHVV
jgi:hypothetical protein